MLRNSFCFLKINIDLPCFLFLIKRLNKIDLDWQFSTLSWKNLVDDTFCKTGKMETCSAV